MTELNPDTISIETILFYIVLGFLVWYFANANKWDNAPIAMMVYIICVAVWECM